MFEWLSVAKLCQHEDICQYFFNNDHTLKLAYTRSNFSGVSLFYISSS